MYAGLLRLASKGVIAGVVNLVIVIILYYGELFQETGNLQMAGLAKGYVIPRLRVSKHNSSTVRDGLSGGSAQFPNGRPCQGVVIPRLKVGKHDGSTVRDGLSGGSAHSAGCVALASD